jgi:hypothetical protein
MTTSQQLSFLTGQPRWPQEDLYSTDVLQSEDVQNVLKKIELCDARLRTLEAGDTGLDDAETRRHKAHVTKLLGLMYIALQEAMRRQCTLSMARHHAGVGPASSPKEQDRKGEDGS